jgi:hypothetical protein
LYKFNNNTKYTVHKRIRLWTLVLYKKSIVFIVRLSFKIKYERTLKHVHFYGHVLMKK